MEKTIWFDGNTPPESGEYHVIIEAKEDFAEFKKGDLEVSNEYYSDSYGWDTIDADNPTWKIVAWSVPTKPSVPAEYLSRVIRYFGRKIEE